MKSFGHQKTSFYTHTLQCKFNKHQLEEREILAHFLKLERKNSSKCDIRRNKLFANTQTSRKTSSAPSALTPSHSKGNLNYGTKKQPEKEQKIAPAEKPVLKNPQQKTTERKTTEEKTTDRKTTKEIRITPKSRQKFNNNDLMPASQVFYTL